MVKVFVAGRCFSKKVLSFLNSRALMHTLALLFGVVLRTQSCQTAFSRLTLGGGPFKTSQESLAAIIIIIIIITITIIIMIIIIISSSSYSSISTIGIIIIIINTLNHTDSNDDDNADTCAPHKESLAAHYEYIS